jgi:predicted Fe-Mo cluster-binding NifX family protein
VVEEQQVLANPHQEEEKAKGIRVAEWLVARKVDVVWLKEELRGRGPVYVFGDAGVEMRSTEALTLAQTLEALTRAGEGGDERGQAV